MMRILIGGLMVTAALVTTAPRAPAQDAPAEAIPAHDIVRFADQDTVVHLFGRPGRSNLGPGRSIHVSAPAGENSRRKITLTWDETETRPALSLSITDEQPDTGGDGEFAIAWETGSDTFLLWSDGALMRLDFSNPTEALLQTIAARGHNRGFLPGSDAPSQALATVLAPPGSVRASSLPTVPAGSSPPGSRRVSSWIRSIAPADVPLSARPVLAWSVEGVVRDERGRPLPDVDVVARHERSWVTVLESTRTDALGRYHLDVRVDQSDTEVLGFRGLFIVPSLDGHCEAACARAGELTLLFDPQETCATPFSDTYLALGHVRRVDFRMLPAGTVAGRVVDQDGKPIPGAYVATHTPDQRPGYPLVSCLADQRGAFLLANVPRHLPLQLHVAFQNTVAGFTEARPFDAPETAGLTLRLVGGRGIPGKADLVER